LVKYGVHSYILTDHWSDGSLGVLNAVRDLGGALVEIPVGDDLVYSPELTRRRALELSLDLSVGPGGVWPVECDLSADDPDDRKLGLAWHKRQVDFTAELGAVAYCGALYGHPGTVKRRLPPVDELPRTAEMLHLLAAHAKSRGVLIVLEPMSHFRTHLVNTPEQAMHLLELADHDNLMLLLDTYHLITEVRDFSAAIRCALPRLWGIHACENDRGVPGGGLVPWDDVFGALGAGGFDGYIVLETYNSSLGDFARRRGIFHDVCPDGPAFIRQGLQFLRAQVASDADARHRQSSPTENR
jgi:D-psicose/D-tagatose/L-ribulose 3-epimerase